MSLIDIMVLHRLFYSRENTLKGHKGLFNYYKIRPKERHPIVGGELEFSHYGIEEQEGVFCSLSFR